MVRHEDNKPDVSWDRLGQPGEIPQHIVANARDWAPAPSAIAYDPRGGKEPSKAVRNLRCWLVFVGFGLASYYVCVTFI